jgi:hypothetical protein
MTAIKDLISIDLCVFASSRQMGNRIIFDFLSILDLQSSRQIMSGTDQL